MSPMTTNERARVVLRLAYELGIAVEDAATRLELNYMDKSTPAGIALQTWLRLPYKRHGIVTALVQPRNPRMTPEYQQVTLLALRKLGGFL